MGKKKKPLGSEIILLLLSVCPSVEDVQLTRGRARMSLPVLRPDPATFKIISSRKMMKRRRQRRRMHRKTRAKAKPNEQTTRRDTEIPFGSPTSLVNADVAPRDP